MTCDNPLWGLDRCCRPPCTRPGERESTESGTGGSHAQAPHHPEGDGQNSNALEHQGEQLPCTGTSTMSQLGGAPERSLELHPASPCAAPLGGGRRDREVPWGTGPAGPHKRGNSAIAHSAVRECLT